MPRLTDSNMEEHSIANAAYGFSATRISELGSTEYTLVGLAVDVSGSVQSFRREIEQCVKEVIASCRNSPRADNLMVRMSTFESDVDEHHGFKMLSECDPDDYVGSIKPGGTTALYDAAQNMIDSVNRYGKDLTDNDFDVNGIVFVITDGMDNASTLTPHEVKKALASAVQGEALESIVAVLVGVNVTEREVQQYLNTFQQEAGFAQYIELKDASAKTLAKLAKFVSQSISSTSQALGTGGPSQSISF